MKLYSKPFKALLALLSATCALAQPATTTTTTTSTTSTTTTEQAQPQVMTALVVTGSYLPPSALVGANPVTIIDSSVIASTGENNILEVLKRLDVSFTGNGNLGTELDNGGAGESYVALRNLTTLVLMDGQRITTSPFSNSSIASPAVDLNTIPLAMIDHIEVLKDGASTVYGSDAIGGVVNIITKKDFNGVEIYGGYGSSKSTNYTNRTYGFVAGITTDTTSITYGLDYFSNSQINTLNVPFARASLSQIAAHGVIPANTGAAYYSGSYPGRVNNDIFAGNPLAVGTPGYNAALTTPVVWASPLAVTPTTLTQLEAARVYLPLAGDPLDVQAGGPTLFNTAALGTGVVLPTDRRQFLTNADHKIFGESLEFTAQGFYTQTINGGSILAPSPLASLTSNNLVIPGNNPYNPFGTLLGVGQAAGSPTVRDRLLENGFRSSQNQSDVYRGLVALKGKINDDYSWTVSADYSRESTLQQVYGGANGAILNQLLIPELNAAGTAYVYNAAGKPLSNFVDPATGAKDLPVYNYFGDVGSNDPATVKAFSTTLFQDGITQLWDYKAIFTGTPVTLPAGKASFSLGAEYLKQNITGSVDGLYANGLALGYNPAATFAGGGYNTKAEFAELGIPIFSSTNALPGLHGLDLTLAGRHEKLDTGPSSNVPKVGLKWQPIDDSLTFRGTYSKGFISPTIYNLFGPPTGNSPYFTILTGNGSSSTGGALPGLPKTTGQFVTTSELPNSALKPSTSEATTLGFVYSPKQVRGFNLSVDYYHIHEEGVGSPDYTGAFASMNALGAASPYASGFTFADGTKLTTNAPNQVTSTNVGAFNIVKNPGGTQWTDGFDYDVSYILPFDDFGKFTVGVNGNIMDNYKFRTGPHSHYNQYAREFTSSINGFGGQNGLLPGYLVKPYVTWEDRGWTVDVDGTAIPSVTDSGSLFGDTTPGDTNSETINGQKYKIPAYFTADASISYDFGTRWGHDQAWGTIVKNLSITVGMNNLSNRGPEYVPSSTENNTDKINYDIIGRFTYVYVSKKF
jgi:iron complex outermembrane receptor protein